MLCLLPTPALPTLDEHTELCSRGHTRRCRSPPAVPATHHPPRPYRAYRARVSLSGDMCLWWPDLSWRMDDGGPTGACGVCRAAVWLLSAAPVPAVVPAAATAAGWPLDTNIVRKLELWVKLASPLPPRS